VVISGWEEGIAGIEKELQAEGVVVKRLAVSHGFHSPQMEGMLEEWKRIVGEVKFSEPRIRFVTDVTGELARAGELTEPSYWVKQVREPVRFARGMKTLEESGFKHYVELGPQAVLTGMGMECFGAGGAHWYPSLRKAKGSEWKTLLEGVQALYVAGGAIDWESFDREHSRRRVLLPTYPFQRQRYWIDSAPAANLAVQADKHQAWDRAVAAGARQSEQAPFDIDVSSFPAKWRALERLSVAYAIATLKQLGAFADPGRELSLDEILLEFHIAPAHRQLIQRWLNRLARAGALRERNQRYIAVARFPDANLSEAWAEAENVFRDDPPPLEYTRRCGERLAAVLTGKESALETLFPGGSFALAENLYQRSAASRYINAIAAAVVDAASGARGSAPLLRILEIGGGTGGTTAALLPRLPANGCEYFFTDASDSFFAHASEKFETYPFVHFGVLNIEADVASQGYAPGSFDMVVAANVLHAARDLDAAVERARLLLAPGGILVLVETTQDQAWFDITTGLIEGWQHFADEWRSDGPLITAENWDRLLRRRNFASVCAFPGTGSIASAVGQHVIVAQTPGGAGESERARARKESVVAPSAGFDRSAGARREKMSVGHAEPAGHRGEEIEVALPSEREDLLVAFVRDEVMRTLRIDASRRPDRRARLMDLGLDSLMAVQLRNRLTTALRLADPLPATLMFDYPTIEAIARYLHGVLFVSADHGAQEVIAPRPREENRAGALQPADLESMSDKDAEELLLKRLNEN
jgi:SAM-dependent methyltransferase